MWYRRSPKFIFLVAHCFSMKNLLRPSISNPPPTFFLQSRTQISFLAFVTLSLPYIHFCLCRTLGLLYCSYWHWLTGHLLPRQIGNPIHVLSLVLLLLVNPGPENWVGPLHMIRSNFEKQHRRGAEWPSLCSFKGPGTSDKSVGEWLGKLTRSLPIMAAV